MVGGHHWVIFLFQPRAKWLKMRLKKKKTLDTYAAGCVWQAETVKRLGAAVGRILGDRLEFAGQNRPRPEPSGPSRKRPNHFCY
jgi:hypothetical protein